MTPFERLFGFSPRSGFCIFCTKKLVPEVDTDFAVCNDCWTKTFACPVCSDESGDCIHVNPPSEDDIRNVIAEEEPYNGTYYEP